MLEHPSIIDDNMSLKRAFAINKEVEVLINEIPLVFFLVGNLAEVG